MASSALSADILSHRFESEQNDLDKLCAPRPLVTDEAWFGNDYYGGASVLKAYAEVPQVSSVKAVVPHGIYFNDDVVGHGELISGLPAVLVFPEYRTAAYREQTQMVTIPSAAPFVYANRLIPEPSAGSRRGTLFMPVHSIPTVEVQLDWQAVARNLVDWPDEMKPITVMAYWHDYNEGRYAPFKEHGFKLVSAGHLHDRDFLLRQAYLLKQHKYVGTNGFGSHLFYAVEAGCKVVLKETSYSHIREGEEGERNAPPLSMDRRAARAALIEAFSRPGEAGDAGRRALADYYLGTVHALSSAEMAGLLKWVDRLDRIGRPALWLSTARRVNADAISYTGWVPWAVRRPRLSPDHATVVKRVLREAESEVRRLVASAIRIARAMLPFLADVRIRGRSKDGK